MDLFRASFSPSRRFLACQVRLALCSWALLSGFGCQQEQDPNTEPSESNGSATPDSEDKPNTEKESEQETEQGSQSPESEKDSKKSEEPKSPEGSKKSEEPKPSQEPSPDTTTGGAEDESSEEDGSEDSTGSTGEDSQDSSDSSDDSPGDGTGYPENDRDCDKVAWGPLKGALHVGATLPRQEVTGYYDRDGDNKVELDKEVTVGTCAMHLTGRKCGIIVAGRKG